MATPEQLFERYRRRADARALGAVFDALASELLLVAAHVAPKGVEPEDLVQVAFVGAIEHADSWDARRPLTPWLIGILVNHARAERRRGARSPDPRRIAMPVVRDPADEAEHREIGERIADALKGLPRHYRQAMTLRIVHGLSPAQIATALGCPVATVKTRLQRGLEQLRRALPAGIAASLAGFVLPASGLAAARAAVLAHAAVTGASVALAAGVAGGVVMKKTWIMAAVAVLATSVWWAWPRDAGGRPAGEPADGTARVSSGVPIADAAPPPAERRTPLSDPDDTGAAVPTPRVHGRVVDEGGAPVGDVRVVLGRASPSNEFENEAEFVLRHSNAGEPHTDAPRRVSTGADGRFAFDAALCESPAVVGVWSPTRGGALRPVPDDVGTEMIVVLPDHGQIFGRVLDENGVGVPDMNVHVYPDQSGMPAAYMQTDESGAFRIVPLLPGSYRVSGPSDRYEWEPSHVELVDGRDTPIEIRVSSWPTLGATLVDSTGAVWTGGRIEAECGIDVGAIEVLATARPVSRRADAGSDGWDPVRLEFDPTTARVTGVLSPQRAKFLSVWWHGARLGEGELDGVDATEVRLGLERPALAQVRVRIAFDPEPERPIDVALRLARPAGHLGWSLHTEAEGSTATREAALSVPASDVVTMWWLSAEAGGYAPSDVRLVLPAGAGTAVHEVTLMRQARTLRGVVVGASGEPVESATICAVGADGEQLGLPARCRTFTDQDGRFELGGLPRRAVRLLAGARDRRQGFLVVGSEDDAPARIELSEPRTIEVGVPDNPGLQIRVLDAAGHVLLDDRVGGSVRYGRALPVRVIGVPLVFEAFQPASPTAWARGELATTDAGAVELVLVDAR